MPTLHRSRYNDGIIPPTEVLNLVLVKKNAQKRIIEEQQDLLQLGTEGTLQRLLDNDYITPRKV